MKSQLKKFKGSTIRTQIGQINLKQYYRLDDSQYDQIYFKASGIDSICKMYDLSEDPSKQRFNNQRQQYGTKELTMLYNQVHFEQVKTKRATYGLVVFIKLDKEPSLQQCMANLSGYQKMKLTENLVQLLEELKQNKKIYCNIRPSNIYKYGDKYTLINAQFLRHEGGRNNMDTFMLQAIQNQWKYWPSEVTDPYSNQPFDYSLDVYAVGCILYQLIAGRYPFQTKLSAISGQYTKLDNKNIIGKIAETFLGSSSSRRSINFKQIIAKLKQYSSQIKPIEATNQYSEQKNYRKGSNNGILDNLSNVFSKMMNDSEGWFLNYVEDNESAPNQKYVDNILSKMYKKQQKAQKLNQIIQKFILNNPGKVNSIKKILLLIGQIIRKGPSVALSSLNSNITSIKTSYGMMQSIQSLANLLEKKVELNQKYKKIFSGNFYISQIANFKLITVQDLKHLMIYLQFLINYVSGRPDLDGSDLSQSIINFGCDEIYDLVSIIIFSLISIRKDNQLQLRNDNLKQLQPVEKSMGLFLKKLSELSNFISAHAIYSLQGQYIPYQEELMLKTNPYYSTLQHFYYNSRSYKGLTIPTDYSSVFGPKQQKKVYSASKQIKPYVQQNGKNYFKQQINSDQDDELARYNKVSADIVVKNNQQVKKQQEKPKIFQINQVKVTEVSWQNDQKLKVKPEICSPKGGKNNNNKLTHVQITTVTFQQFGNLSKPSNQNTKIANQFDIFNQVKKEAIKKPPLPQKKQAHLKQAQTKPKSGFHEFDQLMDKSKKENKTNSFVSFNELNQNKSAVNVNANFDCFNPFTNQIAGPKQVENPLVTRILQGLKLKQLKQLIMKNKKYVIDFNQLKLNKVIGSGSAGQVYHGSYKDQQVAIKKVKAKQNPNALKQFQRQLVTYIKIKTNPHLVSLVGVSQSAGDIYLVTQFCSSGSLFDLLHKKKMEIALSWKERLNFAIQIAEGMHFLHSMKPIIIHRDLKSLNVFVTKIGNAWKMKVADFGLSRSPQADMMTTQLGTIHWMAPQLLQGKQYSYKVDVYSYGVLLWQILSRMTPYSNLKNPMAILKYVVIDKQRPEMQSIPKQCPQKLVSVMIKCWAHEPNDRPTFSEIIQQLKLINL